MSIGKDNLDFERIGAEASKQVGELQVEPSAARTSTMGRQIAGQWRPVGSSNASASTHSGRPTAPVGVITPPKPAARSTDLSHLLPSNSLNATLPTPTSESQHPSGAEPENDLSAEEHRKLIANIPEDILASLRSTCAAKAEVSLLGRIHGKHPGLKALTAWARDTLHSSLSFLSLKNNNLFEVTFSHPEGRIHALTQADLVCDTATIFFSSWRPHFDSKAPQAEESLDHPVWVQIVDLCQVLREEPFLKIIGEQIGQVVSIDNSEAYRSKLFGPRIRLLVQDLQRLPQTVVIPRLDGEGTVEYTLEYSGLPHQCGRCRGHDHLVRNCPKKYPPVRKKDTPSKNKIVESSDDPPKITETGEAVNLLADNKATQTPSFQDQEQDQETTQVHLLSSPRRENIKDIPPVLPSPQSVGVPVAQDEEGETLQQSESLVQEVASPAIHSNTHNSSVGQNDSKSNTFLPDDINFPKLQTPTPPQRRQSEPTEPQFVWRAQQPSPTHKSQTDGSKGKGKQPDSTPITRQGYRTGRLAEDFWSTLGTPNTPSANSKKLKVIPFLTKNRHTDQAEYLVDGRGPTFGAIAHVQIAEVLAGIPWTQARARQHVVDEVSQTLHKLLIFNNNISNPFQRWNQGHWYAQWGQGLEGESVCTLYVSVDVLEQKIKPRKGNNLGWRKEPVEVSRLRTLPPTEDIHAVEPDSTLWQKMAGRLPSKQAKEQMPPETHNRFASLLSEEDTSDQLHNPHLLS